MVDAKIIRKMIFQIMNHDINQLSKKKKENDIK